MSDFAEPDIELGYTFWEKYDCLGLINWLITPIKITTELYFDDDNINVDNLNCILNTMVRESLPMLEKGWKPNFNYVCLKPEPNLDFTKRVNFILDK